MRYWYVPGSIEAHDRSMLPPAPVVAEDACRILVRQHVVEHVELPPAGRRLHGEVEWCVTTHAVAERLATMELVETHVQWITHRGVWCTVTWTGGGSPQAVVRRPYPHKLTLAALRVLLGLDAPPPPPVYADCPCCGRAKVKRKADGDLMKHRSMPPWACA